MTIYEYVDDVTRRWYQSSGLDADAVEDSDIRQEWAVFLAEELLKLGVTKDMIDRRTKGAP